MNLASRFIIEKGGLLTASDKHGWSVLQYAVRYATLETVEKLIELGADIFHRERKGWTCLHLAARNGQPEKARLLLENGASVNETQDQGWNALHLAVRSAFVKTRLFVGCVSLISLGEAKTRGHTTYDPLLFPIFAPENMIQ